MSDYPIEAGPAQPVAIVSGNNSQIGAVSINQFVDTPVGNHIAGTNISSAYTYTKPAGVNKLIIQVTGANARIVFDGATTPTTSVGFRLVADTLYEFFVPGASVAVIQESATAAPQLQWMS